MGKTMGSGARTALAERLDQLRACAGASCAVADYSAGPNR